MSITESQRFHLKKSIKELEGYRGRHTELVSVYVPQDYDLNKIVNHLAQEQGTAANIKSSATRKNVTDALERMIQHLRLFKKTPPNGLVVFSGNVAEREGTQDFRVWSIEPPIPLKTRIYRCDKEFVLDILRDMLDIKEVYGLVVMDRRDANIALLKGKTIIPLVKTHSEVPGKFKAGGQCLVKGTLIQTADGLILPIERSHNPMQVKSVITEGLSMVDSPITGKWETQKNKVYKIVTKYPRLEVESSKDHVFFVSTQNGIAEKPAEELKVGDFLIMPEKIQIDGELQKIDCKRFYNSFIISEEGQRTIKQKRLEKNLQQKELAKRTGVTQTTISSFEIGKLNADSKTLAELCKVLEIDFNEFILQYAAPKHHQGSTINLPTEVDYELSQFLGYLIGDGTIEQNRLTFFEQNEQVATAYKKKFDKYFRLDSSYRFRDSKNYHQIRFTSRPLVRLIQEEFPEVIKKEVPEKVLRSKNDVVAGFLTGIFDAEGYVSAKLAIGMNNKRIIQQIQMLLLRFGILSSVYEYDNRRNPYSKKIRYTLEISDKQSLVNFKKSIGFTSLKKNEKLAVNITKSTDITRNRQILASGKSVAELLKKHDITLHDFGASAFFNNKRMMGKPVFNKKFLAKIRNKSLKEKLLKIYNSPVLPVKISKIVVRNEEGSMIDISVKNENFIANGVIVHNSAMRFQRLIEGAAKDHSKKVAEYIKESFLHMEGLKGIIVGGPGQTKYDLVEGDFITNELRKKIIAIKDLSYTGDFGLEELLEKSEDVLAAEEVIEEKKLVGKFLELLAKNQKMTGYGEQDVIKKLEMGAVDKLLLSEALDEKKIEEFENLAKPVGTEIKIISTQTREGAQLRDLGKIAAILRYEVHV